MNPKDIEHIRSYENINKVCGNDRKKIRIFNDAFEAARHWYSGLDIRTVKAKRRKQLKSEAIAYINAHAIFRDRPETWWSGVLVNFIIKYIVTWIVTAILDYLMKLITEE